MDFRYKRHFKADRGEHGMSKTSMAEMRKK